MIPQELIDALDYCPETGIFTWKIDVGNNLKKGDKAGSVKVNSRLYLSYKGSRCLAAKLAVFITTGKIPHRVGFKDGNRLNLSFSNLVFTTDHKSFKSKPVCKKESCDLSTLKDVLSYCQKTGDFYWIKDINYNAKKGQKAGYLSKDSGYFIVTYKRKMYLSHRLAWLFTYGEWPKGMLDHINGNKVDNRICNLRLVSKSQNSQNSYIIGRKPLSEHKNISYQQGGLYVVRIKLNGKYAHYSSHKTLEEAIATRDFVKPLLHSHHPFNNPRAL